MSHRSRLSLAAATAIAVIAFIAAIASAATRTGAPTTIAADHGTIYASINYTKGSTEYTSGTVLSSHFGAAAITYQLHLTSSNTPGTIKVTSPKVVLYTSKGTLTGTGSALVSGGQQQTITQGKIDLTKGTGALKGYHYSGTFTGLADLSTNKIKFTYKAKLTN